MEITVLSSPIKVKCPSCEHVTESTSPLPRVTCSGCGNKVRVYFGKVKKVRN